MLFKKLAKKGLESYKDFRKIQTSSIISSYGKSQKNKIIGFVKFYNEGNNGNLERCLKHLSIFCNDIALCDDGSTDNSSEIARKYSNKIIKLSNDFKKEIFHKQELLEFTLSLDPDWIVWLDADETFDRSGELGGIRALSNYGDEHDIDSFSFLYYNLWKSNQNYRVDELWHSLQLPKLWKNTGDLKFDVKEGLHSHQYPLGIKNDRRTDVKVIHYGFASKESINNKYLMYKNHGQSGRALERIKDEKTLELQKFSRDWFPMPAFKITVVCLIYKSIGYANFVLDSFKKHTNFKGKNIEFLFIANDPTEKLVNHLEEKQIPFLLYRNDDPDEYYLNRVYRAWNFGGFNASGDVIVLINSDMAFSDNWLDNLIRNLREDRIVTSRLVESGKIKSGKYGIEKNFGQTYSQFNDEEFQKFAKAISSAKLKDDGLFMPCAIYKDLFKKSGGYPIGNRTEKNGKITPGDKILFYEKLLPMGIKHYTVFDSIVYHIQEGEMDS